MKVSAALSCSIGRLLISLASLAVLITDSPAASEAKKNVSAPPGSSVLPGRPGVQFLIGKSLIDPPGTGELLNATYFINDSTVLEGYIKPGAFSQEARSGYLCSIRPWKFTETEDCDDQSNLVTAKTKCTPFRVLISDEKAKGEKKPGTLVGYYWKDRADIRLNIPSSFSVYPKSIVEGNMTRCPLAAPPAITEAIEFPETDQSVATESATPWSDGNISSATLVKKILVGNSVVWPKSDNEECGETVYFNSDGRIYSLRCNDNDSGKRPAIHTVSRLSDRPVLSVATSRWKLVDGRFCIENYEAENVFDQCDPILLSTFLAQSQTSGVLVKRLHAFFIYNSSPYIEPTHKQPGLVVRGNPAGFSDH